MIVFEAVIETLLTSIQEGPEKVRILEKLVKQAWDGMNAVERGRFLRSPGIAEALDKGLLGQHMTVQDLLNELDALVADIGSRLQRLGYIVTEQGIGFVWQYRAFRSEVFYELEDVVSDAWRHHKRLYRRTARKIPLTSIA